MKKEKSVILPGSYDPITLGHLDIIRRAANEYKEVYVVAFINPDKKYTFSLSDRVKMLLLATEEFDNVMVSYSLGYVVDYMREHNIGKIIKGYRNDEDLEYEKRQAEYNFKMGGYETELWKSKEKYSLVSSTAARELISKNENLTDVLPLSIIEFIKNKSNS